ncbi:DUF58 domain-containing protein [Subtercola endophyticus]|uniref:DUF58 domain-containing protein n=1 Tax=Subtercola endophyticus TaxID=2895559 RepID=UPI001E465BA0|nr:DUF58 domain-containing protein [Subtercola endophyticus]UFS59727.1 DUF58 domain-containing protein [Subtercola endophyticus]
MAAAARLFRRLPRLTLRGWAFLVTGIAVFVVMEVLQRREFAFVGIFLVALPVLAAFGVSLYRLPFTVERRFSPELAAAGSVVAVRLIVRNWGSMPGPEGAWFDAVPAPLRATAPESLKRIRGFRSSATEAPEAVSLGYELDAGHRGQHAIGPFTLLITDPFGMAVGRRRVGGTDVLTVTPSTVPLPHGALRLASGSGSARQSRRLGAGGEHDVISRKYQTGDSMRRVNWSATARFGELMVRQDDQQNDQHAVVILDSAFTSYAGSSHTGSAHAGSTVAPPFSREFEWAVSMAASIGLHLVGEGFHVRMIDSSDVAVKSHDDAAVTVASRRAGHSNGQRFEPHSGDEALLLHTAHSALIDAFEVDYRVALSHNDGGALDLPPVFAVVGDLSAPSARSLAASARLSSGAVAIIVVEPVHGDPAWALDLRDELEAGGWVVNIVHSDEAPSVAWGSLDGERLVL